MPTKSKSKIIQICAPACPVYAVYSLASDGFSPTKKEDLLLSVCPVVALIEEDGDQIVKGLISEDWGLDEPSASNFLGYANSLEDATGYLRKEK